MSGLKRLILWKLSLIYRVSVFLWDQYWRRAKKVKLPGKVISIGNITAGGTGKTPLAIYVGNLLAEGGLRTAVVARGYGRPTTGLVEVNDDSTWLEVGDEPLEIYQRTKNVRVYVDKSKTRAAQKASADGADIIIVDDGFQHRKLHRDINIACLDWNEPFGPGGILPKGLLREPIEALRRADIIIYTNYNKAAAVKQAVPEFVKKIKHYYSSLAVSGLRDIKTGAVMNIAKFRNKTGAAFCGVGNAKKFWQSLYRANIRPVNFQVFQDHYRYNQTDIDKLIQLPGPLKLDYLITTYKDAVKIQSLDFKGYDVYSAELDISIIDEHGNCRKDDFRKCLGL